MIKMAVTVYQMTDDLVSEVLMEDYAQWQQYEEWRPLNVQGMANFLQASGQVN